MKQIHATMKVISVAEPLLVFAPLRQSKLPWSCVQR